MARGEMTDHALHVFAIALLLEIAIQVEPPSVRWYEVALLATFRVLQAIFLIWFLALILLRR